MSIMSNYTKKKRGIRRYIGPKRVIVFFVFMAFAIWTWNYYQSGLLSPSLIEQYRENYPVGSVMLFILIYAISVIASLPSLPLNLAAGFFWGGFLGGVYTTLGVTIGGWASFSAARSLLGQPLAKSFDNIWASKIQREFERGGWKFVAFVRMNPIIPTGPLNYLLGITSLSNRDFLWTTFVFLLPAAIAVAYIGDSFQTFTRQGDVNEIVRGILVVSAAITFLVGIKFASRIFKQRTDK